MIFPGAPKVISIVGAVWATVTSITACAGAAGQSGGCLCYCVLSFMFTRFPLFVYC